MNCERSRELFADYLGEELARDAAQELQLHLKTCQGCRQELALLGSTKATLKRALPEVTIPRHLSFNFSKPQPQGWFGWLRQTSLRKSGSRYGLLRDLCGQPCSFPHTT